MLRMLLNSWPHFLIISSGKTEWYGFIFLLNGVDTQWLLFYISRQKTD